MDAEAEAFSRSELIQFGLLAMGVGARDMQASARYHLEVTVRIPDNPPTSLGNKWA